MARGKPAVWSTLLGLPFAFGGTVIYAIDTEIPSNLGIPFLLFGGFIIAVGGYVHLVSVPDPPKLRDDEELLDTRYPTQRLAVMNIAVGVAILLVAVYLLFFTSYPYVYPTVTLLLGLYFFSSGLHTYWANCLTNYYVTNRRIIKTYQFVSLLQQEIPLDKIRGVEERKSLTEAVVGLGNVRIASGGGNALTVKMKNMDDSSGFADEIRNLI